MVEYALVIFSQTISEGISMVKIHTRVKVSRRIPVKSIIIMTSGH